MALGRSSFSTSVGTSAEYAGPPKDCAQPTTNDSARMCQTFTTFNANSSVSRKAQRHLHVLRPEQHAAAVDAVGDDAADQREQYDGDLAQETVEAQQKRRAGDGKHQPALRHDLHPGADRRSAGAEPQQAELAVMESLEDPAQHKFTATAFPSGSDAGCCRRGPQKTKAGFLVCSSARSGSARQRPAGAACAASKSSTSMARWRMPGSSSCGGGSGPLPGMISSMRAIGSAHEVVAGVLVIDDEFQMRGVPFGQRARVG